MEQCEKTIIKYEFKISIYIIFEYRIKLIIK